MKHLENLIDLLRPLGVYDLRAGTVNRGELESYALPLDDGLDGLNATAREMNLASAEDFGLSMVEALLPYRPVSVTVEQRRAALAALLRIGGDSFTPAAINDTLAGCGVNARAEETDRPGYVEVYFPGAAGVPEEFERLRLIIEEILPCHLGITYVFWFRTWGELADMVTTFGGAVDTGKSWHQLSIWKD